MIATTAGRRKYAPKRRNSAENASVDQATAGQKSENANRPGAPGRLAFSLFWPAVAWTTLAFSALFLLFGAYFRRPAVVAIIYSFCLEVVLGNMPGYLKRVSVGFYSRCLMYDRLGELGVEADRSGVFLPVDGTTALFVLIGGTVALLGLGMVLFSRTQYHEVD